MPVQPTHKSTQIGDPADWVDRYGDALFRYAVGRVSSRELAEDLVQETFLAAFRHRGRFDGKCDFGTWLVAILRRKIVDHYRKSGRESEIVDDELVGANDAFDAKGKWVRPLASWRATPDQLAEKAEFWDVVRDCLESVPAHLAQAFQLRDIGAASIEEVSRLTGISPRNSPSACIGRGCCYGNVWNENGSVAKVKRRRE